jgi:thymidylate synthase (FAD)
MSKVQLVGKTTGVGKYKDLTSEEIVSAIARHGIIKEDGGKLVKYLMKEHHWSPLDMIDFTFEVETSRAIGRQWLRHSSIRPQEHSQRYSDRVYFEDIELRLEDKVNRQSSTETVGAVWFSDLEITGVTHEWTEFALEGLNLLNSIEAYYKKGIKLGVAKECMRSWLPECTTSTLTFKGSLRSWLSFLNVRCDHHSQKEIVELANLVGEALEKEMPNVFAQIDWRKGMFM